ncbi:MAG: hypothetical protein ACRELB_01450, partial [Polyangiaceae bacterium]
ETLVALGDSGDPLHRIRALVCEDDPTPAGDDASTASPFASCQLTALPDLAVDTINVSLYGTSAPFESDRRQPLIDAIAARTTDLACIVEAYRDSDKMAIAAAARPWFGYSFYPTTDLTTAPADPSTADGGAAPAPSGPPCDASLGDLVTQAYACMEQYCASPPDASGVVGPPSCLTSNCAGPIGAMLNAGNPPNACFACIIDYAVSQRPLAEGQTACTQSVAWPFSFDGSNPSMILSRYAFAGPPQAYILPSASFRRSVLYAPIQLEDQIVDFFCAQLSSPLIDTELPYYGPYGSDVGPDGGRSNGYEDEEDLQVQRVISFVQSVNASTHHPAIIAGDWRSTVAASVSIGDGGTQTALADVSPEVMRALDAQYGGAFVRAEPQGYVPFCTYCPAPADLYNVSATPEDFTPTLLLGFAPGSTSDDSTWGTGNDLVELTPTEYEPLPAGSVGGRGPLFEYYPRSVRVLRPVVH